MRRLQRLLPSPSPLALRDRPGLWPAGRHRAQPDPAIALDAAASPTRAQSDGLFASRSSQIGAICRAGRQRDRPLLRKKPMRCGSKHWLNTANPGWTREPLSRTTPSWPAGSARATKEPIFSANKPGEGGAGQVPRHHPRHLKRFHKIIAGRFPADRGAMQPKIRRARPRSPWQSRGIRPARPRPPPSRQGSKCLKLLGHRRGEEAARHVQSVSH